MPYDLILGVTVSLCVLFVLTGRHFSSQSNTEMEGQLDRYLEDDPESMRYVVGQNLTQTSFFERVLAPMWRGALGRLGRLAPQRNVETIAKRLDTAGHPHHLNVLNFLGLKFMALTLFAGVGFLLAVVVMQQPVATGVLFVVAFAVIGFYMPNFWLSMVINKRKGDIMRALPDALDMIVIAVEAGQSFDQALKRVSNRWVNPLTEEFVRIITEIALGRTRREALISASERIQVSEVSGLITAIVQAEQLGVRIGTVLRVQADQIRTVRRQRAEGMARQATIKMLFPLVFLIFPAMFAVLLGPAVPLLLDVMGGF